MWVIEGVPRQIVIELFGYPNKPENSQSSIRDSVSSLVVILLELD